MYDDEMPPGFGGVYQQFCWGKKEGKKTVVYCKLQRLRLHEKSTAVLIIHTLFLCPFPCFQRLHFFAGCIDCLYNILLYY